jgi:hypothetical protein
MKKLNPIKPQKMLKKEKPFDILKNEEIYSSIDNLPKNWKGVINLEPLFIPEGYLLDGKFQHIVSNLKSWNQITYKQYVELETNDKGKIVSVTLLYKKRKRIFKVVTQKDYGIIKSRFSFSGKLYTKDRGIIPHPECKLIPYEGSLKIYDINKDKSVKLIIERNYFNGYKYGIEQGRLFFWDKSTYYNEYKNGKLDGISYKIDPRINNSLGYYIEYHDGNPLIEVKCEIYGKITVTDYINKEEFEFHSKEKFRRKKNSVYGCGGIFEKGIEKYLPKFSVKFPSLYKSIELKSDVYLTKRISKSSSFELVNLDFFQMDRTFDERIVQLDSNTRNKIILNSELLKVKNDGFISLFEERDLVNKTSKIFILQKGMFKVLGKTNFSINNFFISPSDMNFDTELIDSIIEGREKLIVEISKSLDKL